MILYSTWFATFITPKVVQNVRCSWAPVSYHSFSKISTKLQNRIILLSNLVTLFFLWIVRPVLPAEVMDFSYWLSYLLSVAIQSRTEKCRNGLFKCMKFKCKSLAILVIIWQINYKLFDEDKEISCLHKNKQIKWENIFFNKLANDIVYCRCLQ